MVQMSILYLYDMMIVPRFKCQPYPWCL